MIFLSASQITLYRECARKWAWKYVAKIPTPQSPAAALGDEIDAGQLQPYLRDARPFDFSRESGYIAAAGLACLPPPQTAGLEVQKHFEMPSPTWVDGKHVGFGYQGFIDLWLPDSRTLPEIPAHPPRLATAPPIPAVVDFKTTSALKWAKTPAELASDVQAMLYATHAMFATGARTVDLVWLYFQTRGPRKTKRTHLRVPSAHVAEQFHAIDETAKEMLAARASVGELDPTSAPLSLPPNAEMCEQYGGCPYRDRCNLSPAQIVESIAARHSKVARAMVMEGNMANDNGGSNATVNLLERMRARKASIQQAMPATSAPTPAPAPPPAEEIDWSKAAPINPPESALPPAPPLSASADATDAASDETPKRKARGAKAPKSALADPPLLLATTPGPAAPASAPEGPHDAPETVTVTWGEETFSPVQFQNFRVGPFSITGRVLPGETRGAALRRLSDELHAFAVAERTRRAESFRAALGK